MERTPLFRKLNARARGLTLAASTTLLAACGSAPTQPDEHAAMERLMEQYKGEAVGAAATPTPAADLVEQKYFKITNPHALKEATKIDPTYALFTNYLSTLEPFPKDGSLNERLERGIKDGDDLLILSREETQGLIHADEPQSTAIPQLKNIPYVQLAINDRQAIWDWFSINAHLSQADIPGGPGLVNESLDYMHANRGTDFVDETEPHVMSNEAEFSETAAHDPRLQKVLKARFKKGITRMAGGNLHREEEAVLVSNSAYDEENKLPPTEELSWVMLIAARNALGFKKPFTDLVADDGKRFPLSPATLAKIAAHNMGDDIWYLDLQMSGAGLVGGAPGEEREFVVGPHFTERGAHLVHGAVVLLGTYGKEIQKSDPQLFESLSHLIPTTIRYIINIIDKDGSNADRYVYGGHLLQSVLDDQAAAVFVINGETLTAGKAIKKYAAEILVPLPDGKLPQQGNDLDTLRWIAHNAATDPASVVVDEKEMPRAIPVDVAHTVAGLKKLQKYLSK